MQRFLALDQISKRVCPDVTSPAAGSQTASFYRSIITLRLSKADQMKTAASPRVLLASRREQLSNCCFAAPLPLPASYIIP